MSLKCWLERNIADLNRRSIILFFFGTTAPHWAKLSSFTRLSHSTTHHRRKGTSGRVISSSQKPLADITQHSQQTSMPPTVFEPTIWAGERPQTYALDRAATGIEYLHSIMLNTCLFWLVNILYYSISILIVRTTDTFTHILLCNLNK